MAQNCERLWHDASRQAGSAAEDSLLGTTGGDWLRGRGGDDYLAGGAGQDWLRGGAGNDELHGEDGNDWLFGGHGDDDLFGAAGRDRLFGRAGDDWLEGGTDADRLHGGRGNDWLTAGDGDDRLKGGGGNDLLDGGAGDDRAHGGKGDDVFLYREGDGDDFFDGQRGADAIRLASVADGWTLHLRRGEVLTEDDDQLSLSAGAAGFIVFADGSKLRFEGVERIETVQETPSHAPPGPDVPVPLNQAPGIVELSANAVYENVAGGTVVGLVSATDPDPGDVLSYALVDDAGGRFAIDPNSGAITVVDGSLLDHETAAQHDVVVQVTDAGGLSDTATFTIFVQFDNSGDDTLTGSDGNDVLDGGDGADFLSGGGGADELRGGAGDDMLFGDEGDDWLIGGDGADRLHGGLDNDRMDGGAGDDRLFGNAGDDVLNGDDGNDTIFGSLGDDVIRGGAGADTLSGGADADGFVFDALIDGVDTITDFDAGDVVAIGNMLNDFVAGQEADFVRLIDDGTNTTVQVDADGAANGSEFTSIAVLSGVTGTTLGALVGAGQIDFLIA